MRLKIYNFSVCAFWFGGMAIVCFSPDIGVSLLGIGFLLMLCEERIKDSQRKRHIPVPVDSRREIKAAVKELQRFFGE